LAIVMAFGMLTIRVELGNRIDNYNYYSIENVCLTREKANIYLKMKS